MADTLADLLVRVSADFGDSIAETAKLADGFKDVSIQAEDVSKAFAEMDSQLRGGATLGAAGDMATMATDAMAAYEAAAKQVIDSGGSIEEAIAAGTQAMSTFFPQATVTGEELEALAVKALEAAQGVDGFKESVAETGPKVAETTHDVEEAGVGIEELAHQLLGIATALEFVHEIKEFGSEALDAADGVKEFTLSLGALGKSSEQVQGTLEQLDILGSTVWDSSMQALFKTATRMTNMLEAGADVPALLGKIADGAAVMGSSISSAANSFERIAERGMVGIRQLMPLGLTLGKLAAAMNEVRGNGDATAETVAAMFKKMDQSERLEVLSTALDKFRGLADRVSNETFSGQWGDLLRQWEQALVGVGEALVPVLTNLNELLRVDIIPFLKAVIDGFRSLPSAIQDFVAVSALGAIGFVALATGGKLALMGFAELAKVIPAVNGFLAELAVSETAAAAGAGALEVASAGAALTLGSIAVFALPAIGAAVAGFIDLKASITAAQAGLHGTKDEFDKWMGTQITGAKTLAEVEAAQDKVNKAFESGAISAGEAAKMTGQLESVYDSLIDKMWKLDKLSKGIHIGNLPTELELLKKAMEDADEELKRLSSSYVGGTDQAEKYRSAKQKLTDATRAYKEAAAHAPEQRIDIKSVEDSQRAMLALQRDALASQEHLGQVSAEKVHEDTVASNAREYAATVAALEKKRGLVFGEDTKAIEERKKINTEIAAAKDKQVAADQKADERWASEKQRLALARLEDEASIEKRALDLQRNAFESMVKLQDTSAVAVEEGRRKINEKQYEADKAAIEKRLAQTPNSEAAQQKAQADLKAALDRRTAANQQAHNEFLAVDKQFADDRLKTNEEIASAEDAHQIRMLDLQKSAAATLVGAHRITANEQATINADLAHKQEAIELAAVDRKLKNLQQEHSLEVSYASQKAALEAQRAAIVDKSNSREQADALQSQVRALSELGSASSVALTTQLQAARETEAALSGVVDKLREENAPLETIRGAIHDVQLATEKRLETEIKLAQVSGQSTSAQAVQLAQIQMREKSMADMTNLRATAYKQIVAGVGDIATQTLRAVASAKNFGDVWMAIGKGLENLLLNIVGGAIQTLITNWLVGKGIMAAATKAETATFIAAEAAKLAAMKATAIASVAGYVGTAGAAAVASVFETMPWFLALMTAPGVGASAAGITGAAGAIAAFEKGGEVPKDMLALVHAGETVVTADLTKDLKALAASGGLAAGGGFGNAGGVSPALLASIQKTAAEAGNTKGITLQIQSLHAGVSQRDLDNLMNRAVKAARRGGFKD